MPSRRETAEERHYRRTGNLIIAITAAMVLAAVIGFLLPSLNAFVCGYGSTC